MIIYKCRNCGSIFTKVPSGECMFCKEKGKAQDVEELTVYTKDLTQKDIKSAWDMFEEEQIDEETKTITEDFFGFEKGTERAKIWKWFNDNYAGGVMELMNPESVKNQSGFIKEVHEYDPPVNQDAADPKTDMYKIQKQFGSPYAKEKSLMVNALMSNNKCCVSYLGDRRMLYYMLPEILATAMIQADDINPEKYLRQVSANAYKLYMIHKQNGNRD